ncbi:2TM domain-containing protein [Dactylosporangium sp. CA-233914]|uniref:2TM domain-containing protein n=1 Tax=Dactylosporangium sp. CA-233914 TaxID=3239934 RepID=UPI003D8AD70C
MTSTKSATQIKWGKRIHLLCYLVANVIQVVVWWLYTPDHFFWPLWSILAWGIGLAFHLRLAGAPHRSRVSHRY